MPFAPGVNAPREQAGLAAGDALRSEVERNFGNFAGANRDFLRLNHRLAVTNDFSAEGVDVVGTVRENRGLENAATGSRGGRIAVHKELGLGGQGHHDGGRSVNLGLLFLGRHLLGFGSRAGDDHAAAASAAVVAAARSVAAVAAVATATMAPRVAAVAAAGAAMAGADVAAAVAAVATATVAAAVAAMTTTNVAAAMAAAVATVAAIAPTEVRSFCAASDCHHQYDAVHLSNLQQKREANPTRYWKTSGPGA